MYSAYKLNKQGDNIQPWRTPFPIQGGLRITGLPTWQTTAIWWHFHPILLVQAYLLEKEVAVHASIPAWEIPRIEEPGGLQNMGHKELDTTEQLSPSLPGFRRQET